MGVGERDASSHVSLGVNKEVMLYVLCGVIKDKNH
jgi:hypothetical protein